MPHPSQHSPSFSTLPQHPTSYLLLQQQTAQLTHTIQIKQNKILYLQSRLKSIKQEYATRLQLIQNAYNQLKKQNHSLEKRYLEEKHIDGLQWQEKIRKVNDQHRIATVNKDKVYEKMITDQQERFQATLKNVQMRYENIVKKLKDQNKTLQNLLLTKGHTDKFITDQEPGKQFTFGTDEYRYLSMSPNMSNVTIRDFNNSSKQSSLMKQKTSMLQQLISLKQKHQKLQKQLQTEKKINLQMQNDHRLQKMDLQEEINMVRKEIRNLNNKILTMEQQKQVNKTVSTQKIFDLQRRNQRIHSHMKQIDQTYLLALTNRTRWQKPSPVTAIKTCNHAGLIAQLQKNIQIKDKQVEELYQKVNHLQKMLGLDKNVDQRLHQIGNISDRTMQIHKSQKERIFNKTAKFSKR